MTDSLSVSYKVYLEDGSELSEVRRFGVDHSVAFRFSFLKEKLQKVFPSLQNKNFDVYWKDQEGDSVVISSDEELTIALNEMNTDLRKLYIIVRSEGNFARDTDMNDMGQPIEGPAIHDGVTCDGCNKQITGFRYKCVVCPDFDLCSTCEGFGMHDEHFMIRISKPIKWRPTYSRRLAHHMAKWSRDAETRKHHHQRRGSNTKCAPGQQFNETNGQCPYSRFYNGHPGWLEYLCNQLGEWVNLPGENEVPSKPGETAAASANTTAAGCTSKPSTSTATENAHGPQPMESSRDATYLQNVAETVAAFLNPMGIDVDIHPRDKPSNQTAEKQKPAEEASQPERTEKAPEPTTSEPMEVSQEAAEGPSAPPEQDSSEAEGWTVLRPDPTSRPSRPEIVKAVDELLENFDEAAHRKIYPTLDDVLAKMNAPIREQEQNTDPQVLHTLRTLGAMGFPNDGVMLPELVKKMDGDIAKVLDVLLARKK